MSARRIWVLIKKAIRLSPQNPILIFALIAPFLYTLLFQVLFGDLLKQKPVVVVHEKGEGLVSRELGRNRGVELSKVGSRSAMIEALRENRADIGVTLPADLTERLQSAGLVALKVFIVPAEPAAIQELLEALRENRADIGVVVPPGVAGDLGAERRVTTRIFDPNGDAPDVAGILRSLEDTATDVVAVTGQDELDKMRSGPGEETTLTVYINGDSLAKDRTIAVATLVGALRELSPEGVKVGFRQISLGEEEAATLLERLLPFIVLVAVLIGAFLLPATFLVQEKEKKTLTALLVTPVSLTEVLVAFGLLGSVLAVLMGAAVLILNTGLTQPALIFVPLVLGSILMTEWGLTAGLFVKDMNSLFANIKLFGIVFYAPAIVLLFPAWPQWIARIFPTYYIVNPVYRISVFGEGWRQVDWQIYILIGIVAFFFLPLAWAARRTQRAT